MFEEIFKPEESEKMTKKTYGFAICPICKVMFDRSHPNRIVCSIECAYQRQLEYQKKWCKKNKPWENPNSKRMGNKRSVERFQVTRYLENRLRIFHHFKNSKKGIDEFSGAPPWKQRLEQMDAIFFDELFQNIPPELKLTTIIIYVKAKIKEQNDKIENGGNLPRGTERMNKVLKWQGY